MYLECREGICGEFSSMRKEEWFDNSHWFDIKFLADVNGPSSNTKEEMKSDTYGDKVKQHLETLGLPMNKVLHLGRNIGTKYLDIMEVDAAEVKRMGQWNQSIYDKSYSSKLPMQAIRSLAGFDAGNGMHFNTRTQVMPPDDLIEMTYLGRLSTCMLQQISNEEGSDHPTAYGVLQWMRDMSIILLQDLAAAIVLVPDRGSMPSLEREFLFVRTPQFKSFTEYMKRSHLEEKSPFDASIDKCLPGVNLRFERAEEQRQQQHQEILEALNIINNNVRSNGDKLLERDRNFPRLIGEALVETGHNVIARANMDLDDGLSPCCLTGTTQNGNSQPTSPEEQPCATEAPAHNSPDAHPLADPTLFRMSVKHGSLLSLWEEWFGLGHYAGDVFGGVHGRNLNNPGWRKGARIDNSLYSRHKRLVEAIIKEAKKNNQQPEDVITEWEPLFQRANFVTGNLVVVLQQLGKIQVRQSRGKTKKNGQQPASQEEQQRQ